MVAFGLKSDTIFYLPFTTVLGITREFNGLKHQIILYKKRFLSLELWNEWLGLTNFEFVHFNAPVTMSPHKTSHSAANRPVALKHMEFKIINKPQNI